MDTSWYPQRLFQASTCHAQRPFLPTYSALNLAAHSQPLLSPANTPLLPHGDSHSGNFVTGLAIKEELNSPRICCSCVPYSTPRAPFVKEAADKRSWIHAASAETKHCSIVLATSGSQGMIQALAFQWRIFKALVDSCHTAHFKIVHSKWWKITL